MPAQTRPTKSATAGAKKRDLTPEPASDRTVTDGSPPKKAKSTVHGDKPSEKPTQSLGNASDLAGDGLPVTIAPTGSGTQSSAPSKTTSLITDVLGTGLDDPEKITTLTREYITEPAISRLNRMLTYVSTENQIYSLRCLPTEGLEWGPTSTEKDNPSLYLHKDGKPITVWIIGELSTFTTRADNTFNASKVNISVQPFHTTDALAANQFLQAQRSPPRGPSDKVDRVWVQRWMAPFGTPADKVPAFTDCYDGSKKWAGKERSEHLRLPTSAISHPDVVLVEASVKRRYETEKNAQGKYVRTIMDRWYVDFSLISVVLLHDAPSSLSGSGFSKELVDFEV